MVITLSRLLNMITTAPHQLLQHVLGVVLSRRHDAVREWLGPGHGGWWQR